MLDFKPTPETPSLQFFESVAAGSPAEQAGLRPGDYLLEVNMSLIHKGKGSMHCQGISQFYLHTHPFISIGMSHTCLCLPSYTAVTHLPTSEGWKAE